MCPVMAWDFPILTLAVAGASTLVIADALGQNGTAKLISIDHSDYYGTQTLEALEVEQLQDWVDLLWVDGPPGAPCLFRRYPALPALPDKLSPHAEVWLDNTVRQEEKDICERWGKRWGVCGGLLSAGKGVRKACP
jgi:hypothetical protein